MLKRLYILYIAVFIGVISLNAQNFIHESLNYQIIYHWGLVWKHAANARIEIKDNQKGQYDARLYARTLSWVDKVYKVRDTLYSTIDKKHFVPIKYVKATHEKGHVGWDIVTFSQKDGGTFGACLRKRPGKQDFSINLHTEGNAYDMLSVFYMLRTIDMQVLKNKGATNTTVFSGKRKERLDIKYVGEERIKLRDESWHNAFHIKFCFTEEGKSKSSDDIDTWISADKAKVPLMLRGCLPIGEVRVYYSGK